MCFCQYVLHREQSTAPAQSVVEHVKDQMVSMRKNALKKRHRRRDSSNIPAHYIPPSHIIGGTSHFNNNQLTGKSPGVTFI